MRIWITGLHTHQGFLSDFSQIFVKQEVVGLSNRLCPYCRFELNMQSLNCKYLYAAFENEPLASMLVLNVCNLFLCMHQFVLTPYSVNKTRLPSSCIASDCYVHLDVAPALQFFLEEFINI